MNEGDYYSLKKIQKGIEQMRDAYGTGGYWEFTSYPDMKPRNMPDPAKMDDPAALEAAKKQPAIVDITMNVKEGEQYFVNRITFVGNTTTLDSVVRREVRLLENGVFNTEALKFSIKKINQLGYFKEIEGGPDNPKVEKVPGQKNKVDVTLKVQEQNRNQLTFGAGVSQYEGFFGQLSFSTQNFLGRGESVTFAVMAGTQVQNYQLAFAEPYVFDRPITAGVNLYKREIQYYLAYTEDSTGGNLTMGFPVRDFTRLFLTYTLEVTRVKDVNPAYLDPGTISRNPFLADALLVNQGGARTISQITPSLVHNTIDNPIFPNAGKRFTLELRLCRRRRRRLLPEAARRRRVVEAHVPEDHVRRPRPGGLPRAVRQHQRHQHADLRAAVPGRRVQRARLRHPDDRPARPGDVRRARRQQGPAVQRGVSLHDCRAVPRAGLLRCGPGEGFRPALRDPTRS